VQAGPITLRLDSERGPQPRVQWRGGTRRANLHVLFRFPRPLLVYCEIVATATITVPVVVQKVEQKADRPLS
jgi:hypothetical protein